MTNQRKRFVEGNLNDCADEKSSSADGKSGECIITKDDAEKRAASRASSAAIVIRDDGTSSTTRSVNSRKSSESGADGTWPEDDREEEDVPALSYTEHGSPFLILL